MRGDLGSKTKQIRALEIELKVRCRYCGLAHDSIEARVRAVTTTLIVHFDCACRSSAQYWKEPRRRWSENYARRKRSRRSMTPSCATCARYTTWSCTQSSANTARRSQGAIESLVRGVRRRGSDSCPHVRQRIALAAGSHAAERSRAAASEEARRFVGTLTTKPVFAWQDNLMTEMSPVRCCEAQEMSLASMEALSTRSRTRMGTSSSTSMHSTWLHTS